MFYDQQQRFRLSVAFHCKWLLIFRKFELQKTGMEKLFRLLLFFFFFLFFYSFFACTNQKKSAINSSAAAETKSTMPSPVDFEKEGYVKATVVDSELSACPYLLQLEPVLNGPEVLIRLEPTNLKEEFKKDQLPVWIKYVPQKGAVSTCMAGTIVELSDIQIRK